MLARELNCSAKTGRGHSDLAGESTAPFLLATALTRRTQTPDNAELWKLSQSRLLCIILTEERIQVTRSKVIALYPWCHLPNEKAVCVS